MREVLSLGAAAAQAFQGGGRRLRVHSVFPATINLSLEGLPFLLSLTGPEGAGFPHSLALDEGGVSGLGLAAGDGGEGSGEIISIVTDGGTVALGLAGARRRAAAVLTPSPRPFGTLRLGEAFQACAERLAAFQDGIEADLPFAALLGDDASCDGEGMRGWLVARARALLGAMGLEEPEAPSIRAAALSLIGAGRGLTPSGDDFLCGAVAALVCGGEGGEGRAGALREAIEAGLGRTNEISASFLRLALADYWPDHLAGLAAGLAAEDSGAALASLEGLLAFGHSSGADIATGFLAGLAAGAGRDLSGPGRS